MPATRARPPRSPRHQSAARPPWRRDIFVAGVPHRAPADARRLPPWSSPRRRREPLWPGRPAPQPQPPSSRLSLRPPQVKAKSSAAGPAPRPAPLRPAPPHCPPTPHPGARSPPAPHIPPRALPHPNTYPRTGTPKQTDTRARTPCVQARTGRTHNPARTGTCGQHAQTNACQTPARKRNQSRQGGHPGSAWGLHGGSWMGLSSAKFGEAGEQPLEASPPKRKPWGCRCLQPPSPVSCTWHYHQLHWSRVESQGSLSRASLHPYSGWARARAKGGLACRDSEPRGPGCRSGGHVSCPESPLCPRVHPEAPATSEVALSRVSGATAAMPLGTFEPQQALGLQPHISYSCVLARYLTPMPWLGPGPLPSQELLRCRSRWPPLCAAHHGQGRRGQPPVHGREAPSRLAPCCLWSGSQPSGPPSAHVPAEASRVTSLPSPSEQHPGLRTPGCHPGEPLRPSPRWVLRWIVEGDFHVSQGGFALQGASPECVPPKLEGLTLPPGRCPE